jgi:S-adenosylmethionine-dependent methyltransferase
VERTEIRTDTRAAASPRTAVVWRALTAELDRQAGRVLAVVDVGGGTGGFAVPLAQAGHRVTVVDPSPDALAALTRRAADAGVPDRVTAVQGDGDRLAELIPAGTADLVLCHSLLEVVDDQPGVLRSVAATLRPGGAASVLVANRAGAVLSRAVNGHLDAAIALVAGAEPGRWLDVATVAALLTGAGLTVEEIHGVRVLADLIPAAVADADPAALVELETRLAGQLPYRDLAAQFHLLARRTDR